MYPSEHTKENRRFGSEQKRIRFLTTLYEIRYADGTEEAFTYDANGNLETHTLATGFVLTYGYDSMDRIVEITGSEGERKSYTYDALGNVTSMTDGEGNITWYAYTLSGQLAKVTDALGNETEYRYDVCDRLIEIRQYGAEGSLKGDTEVSGMDAKLLEAERQNGRKRLCQITRYTRDLRGQVTETMDALGQKETYTYDKKGQLLGKLDKEGYLTKYAYTKQGCYVYCAPFFLETTYASCSGSTPASISNFVFLRIFGAFKASPSLSPTLPMKR